MYTIIFNHVLNHIFLSFPLPPCLSPFHPIGWDYPCPDQIKLDQTRWIPTFFSSNHMRVNPLRVCHTCWIHRAKRWRPRTYNHKLEPHTSHHLTSHHLTSEPETGSPGAPEPLSHACNTQLTPPPKNPHTPDRLERQKRKDDKQHREGKPVDREGEQRKQEPMQ